MIEALFASLFPVFTLIALGAWLGRTTELFDGSALAGLVSAVGIPALLLHSVLEMNIQVGQMMSLIGATVVWLLLMALLTWAVLKCLKLPVRQYLSAVVNPNTGNMGVPVCFALFGPAALGPAMIISSIIQVSHFTLGVGCLSGRLSARDLIRNGPVVALLVGVVLVVFEVSPPAPVRSTLEQLGAITIPIMLMQLGSSLARLTLADLGSVLKPLFLSVYRPVAGAVIALVLVWFWPLSELEGQVLVVQSAMSVAVLSYVLAVRYDGPSQDIALMIPLSLVVSLVVAVAFSLL